MIAIIDIVSPKRCFLASKQPQRRQRQPLKTIGFMGKTTALHVHHNFSIFLESLKLDEDIFFNDVFIAVVVLCHSRWISACSCSVLYTSPTGATTRREV